LACAFSGPLLKGLEIPGIGFHLTGDSSTGKTTALCVASSVWGSGSETDGFLIRWQTTINRLEIEAACRCDVLLPIDESHQAPTAAVLDSAPYMLVNGQGKTRLNRDSSPKETLHWRVCVLSTGESPLEQHLADAKIEHKVGQNVRICDIPLKAKYGIFDSLGCFTDPNAFSDSLRLAASSFYGTPGPVFVQKLIETRPNLKIELDQCFAGLKSKLHSLSAQQTRVLRSFALVALAGELATSFGILPFSQGDSLKAVSRIFATWKTMQPDSIASKESAQILAKITDFIDTHATSRFSHLAGGTRGFIPNNGEIHQEADSKVINRAGYTFKENGSRLFGFTSSGLREAAKGYSLKRAVDAIQEANAFAKERKNGQKCVPTRIPGEDRVAGLYWINPEKLSEDLTPDL
jgi:putative DNA primase/helicase